MPPKTVVCTICKQEVLKSQTLALASGDRACRNHSGVEDEAKKLQEAEKSQRELDIKRKKEPPWKRDYVGDRMQGVNEFREYANSHCWTCGCEGISLSEYFAQSLVAMEQLRMRGKFNFLTMHRDIVEVLGHPNVLAMIPYDDQKDNKIRHSVTDRRIKDILHFLKLVNMCVKCVEKFGVKDRLEALMPKPTWEQLEAMAPVVAAIEPMIKELAEKKERQP